MLTILEAKVADPTKVLSPIILLDTLTLTYLTSATDTGGTEETLIVAVKVNPASSARVTAVLSII